ncbi:peroxisomal membrane protein 2 isoform X3 [Arvicola amphibius]|uniref:peroxisomal membrane protein 2 isoform X3 n=1 Tax=Arvicola amphibius TaxID=1047088 RepID=UPI0018E364B8|nr:peroxisomal membrane protein 2 isoform X3 [Arvicola amphibius]
MPNGPLFGERRGLLRAGTTMAPAASRLRAESEFGSLPRRVLAQYLLLLKLYPVFTKAVSSGILSALGNLLAQMIEKKQKKDSQSLDVKGLLRYLVYGFFVTGPLSHYFYLFMDYWIPPEVPLAIVKRLLLDRLLFAPAFLLLFFLIINLLEEAEKGRLPQFQGHPGLQGEGCRQDEEWFLACTTNELEDVDTLAVH